MNRSQKITWFWLIVLSLPAISLYLRTLYVDTATFNSGIAFSLPLPLNLIYIIAALLLLVLIYSFYKNVNYPFVFLGFGLIVGGGVGNLLERLLYKGQVADYWNLFDISHINFSDLAISLGVIILLLQLNRSYDHT